MSGNTEEKVLQLIDEKELVDLAVAMGNIPAPSGYEQPMADFVLNWLQQGGRGAPRGEATPGGEEIFTRRRAA